MCLFFSCHVNGVPELSGQSCVDRFTITTSTCLSTSFILEVTSQSKRAAGASGIGSEFQVEGKKERSLSSVSPLLKSFPGGNLT